ncbi:Armadillo-like helical [Cynara cardunculus var. scolymus]|uniref:Armadillo-like helical n=1 Tax=Cynara cardunculus var. scolymus TaxID=59895 RepID=A0A103XL19_CYNCS|nr:Armadillo-like helical [Cynara cardunculus var. scolymus]
MMSETALGDLDLVPKSERTNESSSKDDLAKPYVEHTDVKVGGNQRKTIISLDEPTMNGNEVELVGADMVAAEVEYIESEKLDDLEDMLLADLESKDWVLLCETLNNVRRFSIYHKEALQDILSAVCKTTIMTCADIFKAFGDDIINSLDPLLVQLLLKSSQDKRFVCEVAEKALITLTIWVSPILLLPKLQPYFKNRNPRIRAKASMCFSRSVPRLGAEGIKEYGIDKLIQIASSQLSDQLPESREAARTLLLELQTAYEKFPVLAPEQDVSSEQPQVLSWEQFCESNLPKLSAQAVLRVTSIPREGLISGKR